MSILEKNNDSSITHPTDWNHSLHLDFLVSRRRRLRITEKENLIYFDTNLINSTHKHITDKKELKNK